MESASDRISFLEASGFTSTRTRVLSTKLRGVRGSLGVNELRLREKRSRMKTVPEADRRRKN